MSGGFGPKARWTQPGLRELMGAVLCFALGLVLSRGLVTGRSPGDHVTYLLESVSLGLVLLGPVLLLIQKGRGRRLRPSLGEILWLAESAPLVLFLVVGSLEKGRQPAIAFVFAGLILGAVVALVSLLQLAAMALNPTTDKRWTSWLGGRGRGLARVGILARCVREVGRGVKSARGGEAEPDFAPEQRTCGRVRRSLTLVADPQDNRACSPLAASGFL